MDTYVEKPASPSEADAALPRRADALQPKDHAEAVARFRSEIVGALTRRDLDRGALRAALFELASQRYRPPGSDITRQFGVSTLERWYYAYRKGGLDALRPTPRSDRGHAQELTEEQRELLLDIRQEHRSASVTLILRTLVTDGRLEKGTVSEATIRRLYVQHGLDRVPMRDGAGQKTRLRWQAERPGALWHGDVCHGPALTIDGVSRPLRVHALLDDASRYIVAIAACHTEREVDMLAIFVNALRRHGRPDVLYLDNGPTYSGEALLTACARLGISLLHAKPYDPQARGKMERFWRTLREGCLDHLGPMASLHDVQVRMLAFLDRHYHLAPHGGLMGRAPGTVWSEASQGADDLTEARLHEALTVRENRRVRRDTTIGVDGVDYELDQGFLAGRNVTVARSLVDPGSAPWVEHDGKKLPLHRVDPIANAHRKRPPRNADERPRSEKPVDFNPPEALLAQLLGKKRNHGGKR